MLKRDTTAHNFANQLLNLYLESRATPGISASNKIIPRYAMVAIVLIAKDIPTTNNNPTIKHPTILTQQSNNSKPLVVQG
jgi:hypothetical protein